MEALLSQFTFLSDQALHDKNFDPSSIDDLIKLFEIDSYKAWAAAMELEQQKQAAKEAEEYLMENAMDELRRFELAMERVSKAELSDLETTAEKARHVGNLKEKAIVNSATASMNSAWKGLSSNKVHPS